MARVTTYLNFARTTEEAFLFYKSVFGTEFTTPIHRFSEVPPQPGQPPLAEVDKNLVMHVALPIIGGHELMGTDAPESMGFTLIQGSNVYINLEPDTRTGRIDCSKAYRLEGRSKCRYRRCSGCVLWQPH